MRYAVKEIYYSLHGEGANSGRPAVFCRFSGCNLWSGIERDRTTALCWFCDTDFVGMGGPGGGQFDTAASLATAVNACWPPLANGRSKKFVVCTGGEPLLQLDADAVCALHSHGFEVAIETNGTQIPPPGIDWICVSPKVGTHLVLRSGHELKLVFPQPGLNPADYVHLDFDKFFLQPMDGPELKQNTRVAAEYCLENPQWQLSIQGHKLVGLR
jgi:7-carboxy-7-deazaguanine synthase